LDFDLLLRSGCLAVPEAGDKIIFGPHGRYRYFRGHLHTRQKRIAVRSDLWRSERELTACVPHHSQLDSSGLCVTGGESRRAIKAEQEFFLLSKLSSLFSSFFFCVSSLRRHYPLHSSLPTLDAMTIYTSSKPDQVIPQINAYSFAISNPNNTEDSHPILVDALTKHTITFGEWKRDTRRWATGLESMGFKRGDVLALFSFNQVDYSITMFGSLLLGGACTTVNSAYTADELAFQLEDSGASVIVTHPELLPVAIEGAKKVGIPLNKILLYGNEFVQGFRPYTSTFPPENTPESQLAQVVNLNGQPALESTALICYSSGTTGKSKGVELTHVNLISNTAQIGPMEGDIHPHENIVLGVLPFYHM